MKTSPVVAIGTLACALLVLPASSRAQNSSDSQNPQVQGSAPQAQGQQGDDDATLEIAPQPGARKGGVEEIPEGRNFNQDEDNASIPQNYQPNTENGDTFGTQRGGERRGRPYLGVTVNYTTKCFLGGEEQGLEVLTVDPNSPAAVAGLHPRTGMNAVGAAGTTLGAMSGLAVVLTPLLARSGALGVDGDLIVAVDDKRVRNESDLEEELDRLKPGDTMYLTVIRPLPDHQHTTMKIAVKVGPAVPPVASAGS